TTTTSYIYTVSLHDALPICSGTRKEELLLPQDHLDKMWAIRNTMQDSQDFIERFLRRLRASDNNDEFYQMMESEMNRRGTKANGDRKSTRLNSSHVSISYAV